MPLDDRELLARLIQCEAGGEGEDGMRAVASVIMNRVRADTGEFSRISNGGDIRSIILQPEQFTCLKETVGNMYNTQNIFNMTPEDIHYQIADEVIGGTRFSGIGDSLFFFNPFDRDCPDYFPSNRIGAFYSRVGAHCFYAPTDRYDST